MESALYSIYALVRKYRTPALSMKYSLYIHTIWIMILLYMCMIGILFFFRLYALHNSVSKLRAKSFFG